MLVSLSRYKFIVVYILYGVCVAVCVGTCSCLLFKMCSACPDFASLVFICLSDALFMRN